MDFSFYICSLVAVISTFFIIFQKNAIYSLIYLIISLLSISGIFFSLGAFFAGALEVIVYAGAIIVLFVFIIMTLNLKDDSNKKEKKYLNFYFWISPVCLLFTLFITMTYSIFIHKNHKINFFLTDSRDVGISLFGPYVLLLEIVSLLLFSALVIVFHISVNRAYNKKRL